MKSLFLSLGASLLAVVIVACSDASTDPQTALVEDGGAPNGGDAVAPAAPTSNDARADANPIVDTGTPCIPVGRDLTSIPTPGRCESGVAETCNSATATLRRQPCSGNDVCVTFELEERKRDLSVDSNAWVASRTIPWAACIPKDAAPCAFAFANRGWSAVELPSHRCDGDVRLSCDVPNVPTVSRPPDGSVWALSVWSKSGWRIPSPCPTGETCRNALHADFTACFPKTASSCDPSSTSAICVGGEEQTCDAAFGFASTRACRAGERCQEGCVGSFGCGPIGAAHCDPAVKPTVCSTSTSYVTCSGCTETTESCATTIQVDTAGTLSAVAGRCAVIHGEPRCIRATDVVCDESTFVGRCDGASAVRCNNGLESPWNCAATGDTCAIAGGRAGCRAANAPSCSSPSSRCQASVLIECCPPAGHPSTSGASTTPCVPGYETRFDCTTSKGRCETYALANGPASFCGQGP